MTLPSHISSNFEVQCIEMLHKKGEVHRDSVRNKSDFSCATIEQSGCCKIYITYKFSADKSSYSKKLKIGGFRDTWDFYFAWRLK